MLPSQYISMWFRFGYTIPFQGPVVGANNIHFDIPSGDLSNWTPFFDLPLAGAYYAAIYAPLLPDPWLGLNLGWEVHYGGTTYPYQTFETAFNPSSLPCLNPAYCPCIRKFTAGSGPHAHGRMYLPGTPLAWMDSAWRINSTGLAVYNTFMASLLTPYTSTVTGSGWTMRPCLHSLALATITPITSYRILPQSHYLRRRRRARYV